MVIMVAAVRNKVKMFPKKRHVHVKQTHEKIGRTCGARPPNKPSVELKTREKTQC